MSEEKVNLYPYVHYKFKNYLENGISLTGGKNAPNEYTYKGFKLYNSKIKTKKKSIKSLNKAINEFMKNFNVKGKVVIDDNNQYKKFIQEVMDKIGQQFPAIVNDLQIENGVIQNEENIRKKLEDLLTRRGKKEDFEKVGKNYKELKKDIERTTSGLEGLKNNDIVPIDDNRIQEDLNKLNEMAQRLEKEGELGFKVVKGDYKTLIETISAEYYGNLSFETLIGMLAEYFVEYARVVPVFADNAASQAADESFKALSKNMGAEYVETQNRLAALEKSFNNSKYRKGVMEGIKGTFTQNEKDRSKVDVQLIIDSEKGGSDTLNISVKNTYQDKAGHNFKLVTGTPYFNLLSDDPEFMFHTFNVYAKYSKDQDISGQREKIQQMKNVLRTALVFKSLIGVNTNSMTNTFVSINSKGVGGNQNPFVTVVSVVDLLDYFQRKLKESDKTLYMAQFKNSVEDKNAHTLSQNPFFHNDFVNKNDPIDSATERTVNFLTQAHKIKITTGFNLYTLAGALKRNISEF